MNQKQIILVLGMGRTGSSALTRVISLCGAQLPERLLGSYDSNLKGHWEPVDVLILNDRILMEHGANWYDPTLRLQCEDVFIPEDRERYLEMIRVFLDGISDQQLVVIKEPRITALNRLWIEAIRRAGIDMKFVISLRHPNEVAASLARRDGLSRELSNALWLKYNLLAERCSRPFPRVFVEYSNMLHDWRLEVNRIARGLSVDLLESNAEEIDQFLDQRLYREKDSSVPVDAFGQHWLPSVYAALSAAAHDKAVNAQLMDEVFLAYSCCERSFRLALDQFRALLPAPASTTKYSLP